MKKWSMLNNPFLVASLKSYRRALKISTYYDAQLLGKIANPFFAGLYASYHPLHLELSTAYSNWLAQGGTLKGNTLSVDQLLKLLNPTKASAWEYEVMGVFAKKTPGYVALFPQGRKPFYRGTKEMRIAAVAQLGINLTGIVALGAVKIEVDNFHTDLISNRQVQLGSKGNKENKSIEVEAAVEAAMATMFGDFGLLINLHKNDLTKVETYFDIDTIRNHEQIIFRKTVPPSKVRNIAQHTFTNNDNLSIRNDGTVQLEFYLASSRLAPPSDLPKVIVEPGIEITVAIKDLGDITNRFLNVRNEEIHDGHCIIEMI